VLNGMTHLRCPAGTVLPSGARLLHKLDTSKNLIETWEGGGWPW